MSYQYKGFQVVYSDSWYACKNGSIIFKAESDIELESLIDTVT